MPRLRPTSATPRTATRPGASHATQMRPLGAPRPLHVKTDARGDPVWVRLKNGRARRVELVRERWRIDDEWWRQRISRAYVDLVLDDGRSLILFFDRVARRWYRQ